MVKSQQKKNEYEMENENYPQLNIYSRKDAKGRSHYLKIYNDVDDDDYGNDNTTVIIDKYIALLL